MTDPLLEEVQKLHDSRLKIETELKKFQKDIIDAVNSSERRVRAERLVTNCNEAIAEAVAKNEQPLELTKKSNDPAIVTDDVEKWLNDVIVENDKILQRAREYIHQKSEKSSQTSGKSTTVKTKSNKVSSSKMSKTSSQRQRDLIIAQQRREEIEKQNEATLRLAKQKQQLEIEQQELELQKLRKEQALRVEELEEENRRKIAEATLAEMALREDLSDSNTDFHETLLRLSASSQSKEPERISDWINNSPNVAPAHAPPTVAQTTSTSNNDVIVAVPPQSVENATVSQAVIARQDLSAVYVPPLSVPPPPSNNTLGQQLVTSVSLQNNPMHVVPSLPMTVQPPLPRLNATITTTATITTSPAVPLRIPAPFNPIVNVPVSHVIPNLTAWTFPHVPVSPSVQVSRPLPQSQPTPIVATTASLGSAPLPTTVHVLLVTCGGTVYYLPPPVVATPANANTSTHPSSLFPSANATPFVPSSATSVTQTSVPSFTIQDVAQILASTKKDHLPEWKLSQYSGDPIQWHEWYGQFKSAIDSAPLTDDVKLTYLKTLGTGKAKVAIAEFAYCGAMYKDALKTLERKIWTTSSSSDCILG